jgi:hypothetical protein
MLVISGSRQLVDGSTDWLANYWLTNSNALSAK